ncbi:cyclic nucleotide-binding domain-containing protein [Nocardioides pocheonensis]|uniref:cyclic nucleotide-binding domain-containing protein n=1 Tax=Nocardioides pocheonensis TaxID=661485 RepID=UPI00161111FA|nr:cyclic nucleotide-binding domain-containing protein [Nocardioides pocheonensis]
MSGGGLAALRRPDIRRLELGWGMSLAGTFGYTVAMLAYAYAEGGPTLVALYGVASTVPGALLTPVLMSLTDRVGGATMLTATTATRTLLVTLAGGLALAHFPAYAVVGLVAAAHSLSATFRPTQATLLPWLARTPAELTAATVTATMAENLAALLGPILAGTVLALADAATALLVSAGCLLLASLSVRGLDDPPAERAAHQPRRQGVLRDAAAGALALMRIGRPAGMVVLAFAQTFVRGALLVLLVVLALDTLSLGDDSIGWLNAAIGLGGLVGAAAASRLVGLHNLGRCFVAGVAGWGVGVLALSGAPTGVVAFAALVLVGLANAFQDAPAFILMPRLLGHEVAGRALGAFELVVMAGMASGSLVAPALADLWGVRTALLVIGSALVVLAVAYAAPFASIDREMPQAAPEVALLREVPVFAPLPLVVMEQLALEVEQHLHGDGETVVREGEPGECFYVVVEGRAAVSVAGESRPDLGPGDGFGEIALLRGVPRTATVTARGPLRLLSVRREQFLRDVSRNAVSSEEAEALARRRLAKDPP